MANTYYICFGLTCIIFAGSVYMINYGMTTSTKDTENYHLITAEYVNTNHTNNSNNQHDILFVYVLDNTQYQCYLSYNTLTNSVKESIQFNESLQIAYEIKNPVNCVADIPVSQRKKTSYDFMAGFGLVIAVISGAIAVILILAEIIIKPD